MQPPQSELSTTLAVETTPNLDPNWFVERPWRLLFLGGLGVLHGAKGDLVDCGEPGRLGNQLVLWSSSKLFDQHRQESKINVFRNVWK